MKPELGQRLGLIFWESLLQSQWSWRPLSPWCASPNSAQLCHVARRSFSLLGLRVFPQERSLGKPERSGHSAVLSVSLSMSSRRWLCSSLPAGSAGSSEGGFGSGSGILELESAQKGNSKFSSQARASSFTWEFLGISLDREGKAKSVKALGPELVPVGTKGWVQLNSLDCFSYRPWFSPGQSNRNPFLPEEGRTVSLI